MNRHKLALLVLLFVYPVITAILYGMVALTAGWEVWERTLLLAPLMVGLMVYLIIPFITTRFKSYLMVQKKAAEQAPARGGPAVKSGSAAEFGSAAYSHLNSHAAKPRQAAVNAPR